MLELKVQDIRLRGRMYTLWEAAGEYDVDDELIDDLVSSIYTKLGLCSGDYKKEEAIEASNPNILDTLSIDELKLSNKYSVQDLLDNELVTQNGNNIVLTKRSVEILKRAAEIQKELDEQNASTSFMCPWFM